MLGIALADSGIDFFSLSSSPSRIMAGNLSFEDLKSLAAEGSIDTVLVCLVDMQGRLMGKRFHVQNFLDSAHKETHCCDYLLATDLEMATPDGYASSSWITGYGDYVMQPDLDTLRLAAWLPGQRWFCATFLIITPTSTSHILLERCCRSRSNVSRNMD